jgi:hypothetical protein
VACSPYRRFRGGPVAVLGLGDAVTPAAIAASSAPIHQLINRRRRTSVHRDRHDACLTSHATSHSCLHCDSGLPTNPSPRWLWSLLATLTHRVRWPSQARSCWLWSSSRGESHPPALTEPYVTVSRHTALAGRPFGAGAPCQCANSPGSRRLTAASQAHARTGVYLSRWNLCQAPRT